MIDKEQLKKEMLEIAENSYNQGVNDAINSMIKAFEAIGQHDVVKMIKSISNS